MLSSRTKGSRWALQRFGIISDDISQHKQCKKRIKAKRKIMISKVQHEKENLMRKCFLVLPWMIIIESQYRNPVRVIIIQIWGLQLFFRLDIINSKYDDRIMDDRSLVCDAWELLDYENWWGQSHLMGYQWQRMLVTSNNPLDKVKSYPIKLEAPWNMENRQWVR